MDYQQSTEKLKLKFTDELNKLSSRKYGEIFTNERYDEYISILREYPLKTWEATISSKWMDLIVDQ